MRPAALFLSLTAFASIGFVPGLSQTASAQTFDPASFVKQLHQRYIGRDPSAEESKYWTDQLARGATADDVHAGVLGSEAYFNRHKRDPGAWIDGAFAMVQNRTPSEAERNAWQGQLVATQRQLRPYRLLDRLGLIHSGYLWARRLKRGPAA